jgi:hypothetical protein
MKKAFLILLLIITINLPSYAQTDSDSSSEETVTIDTILADISDLRQRIRKNNKDKSSIKTSKTLLSLERRLDKAVKLTPPSKCNEVFTSAVKDFYALVSKLSEGISCGPPIIPPFDLEVLTSQIIGTDCLPPSDESSSRVLVNVFSECYGIYEKTRQLYQVDLNGNGVTDVCE